MINYPQSQSAGPRKTPSSLQLTPNEMQAKEKLMQYVYEYLIHINATKTAETFKSELLTNQQVQVGEAPGFLLTWFNLFWDLYSGDPERRDKCNPTQEAKAFHDFGFVNNVPGSNNMGPRPGFMGGPPMGMPPNDGMMSPFYRPPMPPSYAGNRPPNFPPGGPNQMMFPPTSGAMNQNRMPRMPNYRMPQRPPYMENPSGGYPPMFMPPDQMQPPSSMTPSTSVPTSMPMNGQMPMGEGGQPALPPLSSSSVLSGLINGEDVKHSPQHHIGSVHGQNGNGTPLGPGSQHASMVGPGSAAPGAPASVQSQPGQPGSAANPTTSAPPQSSQPSMPPAQPNFGEHSNMMDFQNEMANNNPNSHEFQNLEIKKIREGLLDDFPNET